MPFRKKGNDEMTERLELRLTKGEKSQLSDDAKLAGITVSEFIRRRSLGRPIIADANMAMVREIRRQGGLVKHLINERSECGTEGTALLKSFRGYVDALTKDLEDDRATNCES